MVKIVWTKKPWLYFPAQISQRLLSVALSIFNLYSQFSLRFQSQPQKNSWSPKTWKHLKFSNPSGIAGGLDKNAKYFSAWWNLGVGFIEVGTVTPRPQKANTGLIVDRNNKTQTLWNKMGFPNDGLVVIKKRLMKIKKPYLTPIFVNIGKNRDTSNQEAHKDYISCIKELSSEADAFVINISSPNTKGLRNLFEPENFKKFLKPIVEENIKYGKKPLILKLSPDLPLKDLRNTLDISCELNIDGFTFCNTTAEKTDESPFPKEGGLSGKALQKKSILQLKEALNILGDRRSGKLIISCGGILTPKDASERLLMGADLIQVYSALVFDGPFFFKKLSRFFKNN